MIEAPERKATARIGLPRPRWWWAIVAPVIVGGGVALSLASSGVSRAFEPPAGPPDTSRVLKTPLPKPALFETQFIERATAKTADEEKLDELIHRYDVTRPLARLIYDTAKEEGIDPELGFRLIRVESVFDVDAVGSGALGLTQLMPGTARDIDPSVKTRKEILEPKTNLRLGFTNLRNMLELFDGDVRLAVIAYNRGEVAVQRAVRRGRDPENGYGERVLGPRAHGGRRYKGPGLIERTPAKEPATADAES